MVKGRNQINMPGENFEDEKKSGVFVKVMLW